MEYIKQIIDSKDVNAIVTERKRLAELLKEKEQGDPEVVEIMEKLKLLFDLPKETSNRTMGRLPDGRLYTKIGDEKVLFSMCCCSLLYARITPPTL